MFVCYLFLLLLWLLLLLLLLRLLFVAVFFVGLGDHYWCWVWLKLCFLGFVGLLKALFIVVDCCWRVDCFSCRALCDCVALAALVALVCCWCCLLLRP